MLYVAEAIGTTLYKIGFTNAQPERRLNELQTGCPYDLRLIYLIEGERAQESKMHNWLERHGHRVRDETGEWFDIKKHELFNVLFEVALEATGLKNKAVSILSNRAENSRKEIDIFNQWLERNYKWDKSSAFNTMLGTALEEVWHEYFMYSAKHTMKRISVKEMTNELSRLKIGYKIDDSGLYYYNMRHK